MNKKEILEYLKSHKKQLFDSYGLEKLALFGSFARGDNSDNSDVDILFEVQKNRKFSLFEYLKLNSYLEKLLKKRVDLVREATLKDDLIPYIKKDLIYV